MRINRRYKIELATTGMDDVRPILCHVQIGTFKGKPVAVAANGFHLAVVPVELDDEDVTGLVHYSLFNRARSGDPDHSLRAVMYLPTNETAVFEDGSTAPRRSLLINNRHSGNFPDYRPVLDRALAAYDKAVSSQEPATPSLAFNPFYLNQIGKVLDAKFLSLHHSKRTEPIIITADKRFEKELCPPFALLMQISTERR